MKLLPLLLLATLTCSVSAKPVHIALQPASAVSPDADGFFTLGAVAAVTGGAPSQRTRLAAIIVGRAPLSGETRRLTRGDLSLKLRQAGCDPDTAAVLEGAPAAEVTAMASEPVGALLAAPSVPVATLSQKGAASSAPTQAAAAQPPVIHRGDPITIVIQSGPLTITAPGVARENGGAGQAIRVHREGVMADLTVHIVDAQTVQMEI